MNSLQRRLLLLGAAVALLLVGCSGSSWHSLRYFTTVVSDPGQADPQFYHVGYVDEQPFVSYDVATRRMQPQVPWMEQAGKEDPLYWADVSRGAQKEEAAFRANLATLRDRYNQSSSTGIHTLQEMYGCMAGPDGCPENGYRQLGYDGEDFISLDKETLTWTAPVPQAQETKRKWEKERIIAQYWKDYLEGECVEWLRRYLEYGRETLQRTVPPTVKVACKKHPDGQETLVCRAHGFYPKEIEVSWRKDGVDQTQDTLTGGIVPNADGTYHKWLSIEVDPEDRGRYRCQVEHDSLLEPLDLAWEEPASSVTVALIVGALAWVLLAFGASTHYRNRGRDFADAIIARHLSLLSTNQVRRMPSPPDVLNNAQVNAPVSMPQSSLLAPDVSDSRGDPCLPVLQPFSSSQTLSAEDPDQCGDPKVPEPRRCSSVPACLDGEDVQDPPPTSHDCVSESVQEGEPGQPSLSGPIKNTCPAPDMERAGGNSDASAVAKYPLKCRSACQVSHL